MKRIFYLLIVVLAVNSNSIAQEGFNKVESSFSVDETVKKLTFLLDENGLKVFSVVDHKKGAETASMELHPTTLIIFGNPVLGTKLMHCDQRVGLDLPMKYLVWEDEEGKTWISYWNPMLLRNSYNLEECMPVLEKMSGALSKFAHLAAQ